MWIHECDATNGYFSYLEDLLVVNQSTYVTINRYKIALNFLFLCWNLFINRLNPLLGCLNDCDFSYLLSKPSVFNNNGLNCGNGTYNDTTFANDVILYLTAGVASTCIYTLCSLKESASAYTNPSASNLISDSSRIL